jgi:hypothetical protein
MMNIKEEMRYLESEIRLKEPFMLYADEVNEMKKRLAELEEEQRSYFSSDCVGIVEIKKEELIEKQPIDPTFEFDTTQTNIVIPTGELIKYKDCDFRVILGMSGISNCDNITKEGSNTRYTTFEKSDRHKVNMCETIGIDVSNFNKKLRTIIKKGSDEFKIVKRVTSDGKEVNCYEINYEAGKFVTIPKAKAERCLLTLGNNPIKLYCNLLWLCQKNGVFKDTHVPQSTLATLMGLSPRSENIVNASMQTLINQNLIKAYKVRESVTTLDKAGLPVSKVTEKYYYNIIVDEE